MTYFELDALDGVAKEFVSVFYIVLADLDGVHTAVNEFVLRNIDGVILHIVYIYSGGTRNLLNGFYGNCLNSSACRTGGKEKQSRNPN